MNDAIEKCNDVERLRSVRAELSGINLGNANEVLDSIKNKEVPTKVYKMVMPSTGSSEVKITDESIKIGAKILVDLFDD